MDYSSVNIAAILDTYVYMDDQNKDYEGMTLNQIMGSLTPKSQSSPEYAMLKAAITENPSLGEIVLVSQSSTEHDMKLTVACTFADPNTKQVFVAYRGTGDGKWVDNGEGMVLAETVMQKEAEAYFQDAMKDLEKYPGYRDYDVVATGHSKGGNLAQYVTLKNPDVVDVCYSLDGQGFSSSAINSFIEELGLEKYENTLKKMYSINGENDYVHDLGNVIIPEENTYFIRTPEGKDLEGWHSIRYMIDGDELNWFTEDGKIIHGRQGEIGQLAKRLSEKFMELPEEQLYDAAITIMYTLEVVKGKKYDYGTGNRQTATVEEIIGGVAAVLPILAEEFISWGVTTLMEEANGIINILKETDSYKIVVSLSNLLVEKYSQAKAWIKNNLNPGYVYAKANSYIKVDTTLLRNYAARLTNVNKRISDLDKAMDSLYKEVGFLDLLDLMNADILTGHSWRIKSCADYLTNTAGDFENAERKINNKL